MWIWNTFRITIWHLLWVCMCVWNLMWSNSKPLQCINLGNNNCVECDPLETLYGCIQFYFILIDILWIFFVPQTLYVLLKNSLLKGVIAISEKFMKRTSYKEIWNGLLFPIFFWFSIKSMIFYWIFMFLYYVNVKI